MIHDSWEDFKNKEYAILPGYTWKLRKKVFQI